MTGLNKRDEHDHRTANSNCAYRATRFLPDVFVAQARIFSLVGLPAVFFLVLFGCLLTLHEGSAARTYAAYGGIYVFSSIMWLWLVERQQPTLNDLIGVAIIMIGAAIIIRQQ
jgi:small multidrug resistance family-3 protein